MAQLVSAREAAARRFFMQLPNGIGNWVTSYMGVSAAEARSRGVTDATALAHTPVAYLVEQPARSTIAGHFHQVDQFQVFVSGSGRFGARPLQGSHLHYAAAFTPYAPIAAAEEPLLYFTLRPGFDPGAQWMPESKAALRDRQRTVRAESTDLGIAPNGAVQGRSREIVIAPDGSGVAAWRFRLGGAEQAVTPSAAHSGGQFLLILQGTGRVAEREVEPRAIAHIDAREPPVRLVAGDDGLDALVVQFAPHD